VGGAQHLSTNAYGFGDARDDAAVAVIDGPLIELPPSASSPSVDADGHAAPAPVATETPEVVHQGRARGALGAVRAFVLSGLFGTVVAAVLLFVLSIPLGFRSLTVMSGSMEPTLGVGDVVMERQVAPLDVRVGDIVTFRDPTDQGTLITHRVRSLEVHDGTVEFVTKGDANNTVEKWQIPATGRLGLAKVHIPKLGYALVWASGKAGRIALIAVPGLILGILELRRIWRPQRSAA
jgi:signal peptidase